MFFLTVQPAPGAAIVQGGGVPGLARIGLAVFFGVPLLAWLRALRAMRRSSDEARATGARGSRGANCLELHRRRDSWMP